MTDMRAFFAMIDRFAAAADDERARLDREIWDRYGVDRAILALDMSEFSLSVRRDGVLSYLCRIRRMHEITEPLVRAHGGEVVKFEADNLLAAFPDASQALRAALRMRRDMSRCARAQPVSIGLGFGRVLLIPGEDAHGDAVNVTFKLGEDVAVANEILASTEFVDALGDAPTGCALEPLALRVSGLELDAFRVLEGDDA